MPGFVTRLSSGLHRAGEHLPLAAVPVVLALLNTEKLLAVATFEGGHVGFKLGLPLSVVTVWEFVSVPTSGVAVHPGLPVDQLPVAVATVPVLLFVQAAVVAGYFGSLRNALDGEAYRFLGNCRQYLLPFLVLTAVPFLALAPIAAGVVGLGAVTGGRAGLAVLVVGLAVVGFAVAGYLFYATPYLLVLRDGGLVDAARRSYALAVEGGPYLAYTLGFAGFVLVVSPFATGFVVNVPVVGLPVGILGGGVLGLAANLTTMRFVADLDSGSSVAAEWETGDGGDHGNEGREAGRDSDSEPGERPGSAEDREAGDEAGHGSGTRPGDAD
jgi:hypothetical protein